MPPKRAKKQSGSGIVDTVKDALKATKLVSTVLSALPNPVAKGLGEIARLKGYGKKKRAAPRKRKTQKGGGFFSDLGQGVGAAAYGVGGGLGALGHGLFGSGQAMRSPGIISHHLAMQPVR